LKYDTDKTTGGFSIEANDKRLINLEWYKSAGIVFNEEDLSLNIPHKNNITITFAD